jgi:hypothetical protein
MEGVRRAQLPIGQWIESVPWDGVDRLPALYETITMEDPRHNRWRDVALRRWLLQTSAVTSNWWLGMAALPAEGMLILQGLQGSCGDLAHPNSSPDRRQDPVHATVTYSSNQSAGKAPSSGHPALLETK